MENITITASNMSELVNEAFMKCLSQEGEDDSNNIEVEGIKGVFKLHLKRLEEQRELVTALLAELPEDFKKGYTFDEFCYNKNGEVWTGKKFICEQLAVMGIALGLMYYCLPRKVWAILPDGVPYVIVE